MNPLSLRLRGSGQSGWLVTRYAIRDALRVERFFLILYFRGEGGGKVRGREVGLERLCVVFTTRGSPLATNAFKLGM